MVNRTLLAELAELGAHQLVVERHRTGAECREQVRCLGQRGVGDWCRIHKQVGRTHGVEVEELGAKLRRPLARRVEPPPRDVDTDSETLGRW